MSVDIGRFDLTLRAPARRRGLVEQVVRELRGSLTGAVAAAVAAREESGVAAIPRMHVTVHTSLRRVRGRDLARAIAEACVDAAVTRCVRLKATPRGEESAGQEMVELLRKSEGVRCRSIAEEGAAWLIALLVDDPIVLGLPSPFAGIRFRASGAAFVEVCSHAGDARAVIEALGQRWALHYAARCGESEARRLLALMPDADEPVREIELAAAIEAIFRGPSGVAGVVQPVAATAAMSPNDELADAAVPLGSVVTGFWLLLPYLVRHIGSVDERSARAIAIVLAQRLGGAVAADDPAVTALCLPGESPRDLCATAVPDCVRVERLAVAIVRDFARTLAHFEQARCGYILRAILSGSGSVRRTPDGWSATLPQSPLRVVLERAALFGPIDAPWPSPRLAMVRDDE